MQKQKIHVAKKIWVVDGVIVALLRCIRLVNCSAISGGNSRLFVRRADELAMGGCEFWNRKTVCMITGASQNFGRALAENMASLLGPESVLILTSRHASRLGVVRQGMYERNCRLHVHLLTWDLAKPNGDQYLDDLRAIQLAHGLRDEQFELGLVVHNASTLNVLDKPVIEMRDEKILQETLNVNVVSMLVTNACFWTVFDHCEQKLIVNMSAPLAESTAPSFGMVGLGRSSRMTVLNVLALETPDVQVLHFNPGALDTSWLRTVISHSHSQEIRHQLQAMYEQNRVFKANEVAIAFLRYLAENEIQSGVEIDARQLIQRCC
ncbi:Sepiapterin reductase [Trichinella pseudospiralis]|uniref:Sepiapterin reductase n=1 Tax=Trichinella pseudospiralis TaxID=6337 RepID=A0A0V1FBG8_TRIPS|nr:Sepiapterin reductase [Trichinella pseudospiralis]